MSNKYASGENVVVSGISCRLPKSDNMEDFRNNLMNGIDMISDDDTRQFTSMFDLPRFGVLNDLSKFDAQFFGLNSQRANRMDPQLRLLLEVTYEAIVDAGVDPNAVRGSKTGVFVGAPKSEAETGWCQNPDATQGFESLGCEQSMFANRLSFFFDFKGPSFAMNTMCSSSLLALHQAMEAIKNGQCDAAVVAGANIILDPTHTKEIQNLGILSPGGKCLSFDSGGDGYCRSEGIVSIYVQKRAVAKRIYCTVVSTKTNSDGYKENGITFPSGESQKNLLAELYGDTGINPSDITYVECHGTGTKVGDPQEVNAVCEIFCSNRERPLLIGSVKSNVGHTEMCAGLAGLAKVIVAMNDGIIPGNIHYKSPNPDIQGLTNGQLQVVSQNTPWSGGLVAVNSFGFGGSNVHVIINSHEHRTQADKGQNSEKPRLFVYSGRTEDGLRCTLRKVRENSDDINVHALLQETAFMSQTTHPFRGYTILNGTEELNVQKVPNKTRPVWFVFSGMGTQWHGMGRKMIEIEQFKTSIIKCDAILKPFDVHLIDMIMTGDNNVYENTTNAFVTIVSIQIALVDVLQHIGIKPDGIIGHSVGELGCAYADGTLTLDETVLSAYWRGHCIENANLPTGAMAAVGLTWEEAITQCPSGVQPACHNAKDTVTVSGQADAVRDFVKTLQDRKIFAKEVNSSGVAFHSHYMKEVHHSLKRALGDVIISPRERTKRWISTSVPEEEWSTDLARYSSADYHINNLMKPVLFQEALKYVPDNAFVIEIAPHSLLQSVLKRSLPQDCSITGLLKQDHADNVQFFLSNIGRCYQNGVTVNALSLHPEKIKFPVPVNTKMISPLLKWDHSQDYDVPSTETFIKGSAISFDTCSFTIDTSVGSEYHFLRDHKIDGRVLFPASGYLVLAWKTLAKKEGKQYDQMRVKISDVDIHRATVLPEGVNVTLNVTILPGTGEFVVTENGDKAVTGYISKQEPEVETKVYVQKSTPDYKLFKDDLQIIRLLKGMNFGRTFQGLIATDEATSNGLFTWCDNWILFLDLMIQLPIYNMDREFNRGLFLPKRIRTVTIDPEEHIRNTEESENGDRTIKAMYDAESSICMSGAVTLEGLFVTRAPERQSGSTPVLERYVFVPYGISPPEVVSDTLITYRDLCLTEAMNCLTNLPEIHSHSVGKNKERTKSNLRQDEDKNMIDMAAIAGPSSDPIGYLTALKVMHDENDKHESLAVEKSLQEMKHKLLNISLIETEMLQVMIDLVLENSSKHNLKILDSSDSGLLQYISKLLQRHPLVEESYITLEKSTMIDLNHVTSESSESDFLQKANLVLADYSLHKERNVTASLAKLSEYLDADGFLLVRKVTHNFHLDLAIQGRLYSDVESIHIEERSCDMYITLEKWRDIFRDGGYEIVLETTDWFMSTTFLLRKSKVNKIEKQVILNASDVSFSWVEDLKSRLLEAQAKPTGENVWLVANDDISGVVGLTNCLRKEPGGDRIRCLLGLHGKRVINLEEVVQTVLKYDLVMNVLSGENVGSFRHLPLKPSTEGSNEAEIYLRLKTRGDLSSLQWTQLVENPPQLPEDDMECCIVHYAALNFRDLMVATGKLPADAVPGSNGNFQDVLGFEFAGIDSSGRRVMGINTRNSKGIASTVVTRKSALLPVPDTWTLEEAATIMTAYTTAYLALVVRGNIRRGEKVLIHSGSGCTGQAAIAVALNKNCDVYTTVSTQEKHNYLTSKFPHMKGNQIFNSRTTDFEAEIMKITKGKGVDVVLNSLAGDKLLASIRVLSCCGRFLEMGKYDAFNNTSLGMFCLMNNISIHGIHTDKMINETSLAEIMSPLFEEGFRDGVIKPFTTKVFEWNEAEQAFRYMATGKHIGKILIKLRQDGSMSKVPGLMPMTCFHPEKSYIITGGLGGFGLQLARWMSERGARHIVLTTRSGVKTGYQAKMLKYLEKTGIKVCVSKRNVADISDVRHLIIDADKPVGGVFHLAMVLEDGILQNLTKESFQTVCAPKVQGAMNLDKMTRELCADSCEYFVVFSSVASGIGNPGQSNYGLANSSMERVCELRKQTGLPGLAIQWGAIGDVGVVRKKWNDNEKLVLGTVPQRIRSCLETLDQFLNQNEPVVMSFIPRKDDKIITENGEGIVNTVFRIIGITDPDSVTDSNSLRDLGIDSLMEAEVKQMLERNYGITARDVKDLTIKELRNMTHEENKSEVTALEFTARVMAEFLPTDILVRLNEPEKQAIPVYVIHYYQGNVMNLKEMSIYVGKPCFGLQCTKDVPLTSLKDMASFYLKTIMDHNHGKPFHLSGYSYGAVVATEIAMQLQKRNDISYILMSLTLLDGFNGLTGSTYLNIVAKTFHIPEEKSRIIPLLIVAERFFPNIRSVLDGILKCTSINEQGEVVVKEILSLFPHLQRSDLEFVVESFLQRARIFSEYQMDGRYRGNIVLVSAADSVEFRKHFGNDYGLTKICDGKVTVHEVPGDHFGFIQGESAKQVAAVFNTLVD